MSETLFTTRQIRVATPADLRFIDSLQKTHSKAVAFLPSIALENYQAAGRIRLAMENDAPAGYILGNETLRWQPHIRPIFQAAICYDAQRRHHGYALLATAATAAKAAGQLVLQANCREGLEANEFWKAAGFEPIAKIHHFSTRGKALICWRLQLTTIRPRWFASPPRVAGGHAYQTRTLPPTSL
jgi:hypothetical protein